MSRNALYMLLGALVVVVIGLGTYMVREETKPEGVEVQIGEGGVSIQRN